MRGHFRQDVLLAVGATRPEGAAVCRKPGKLVTATILPGATTNRISIPNRHLKHLHPLTIAARGITKALLPKLFGRAEEIDTHEDQASAHG